MATGPQAHRDQVLEAPTGRRKRAEGKPKKNFSCQECPKAFNSLEKLKVHSYSHSGERPYCCSHPDCTKAFVSKYKLLRHMATHSPEKNHKCSYCEKMFHRKDHLKNHLHTHDPYKEAFSCHECGKSYNTKLGFKRHLAMHSAHSGDLTCQVCLQAFPSTGVLLDHLKSHAGKSTAGAKEKKHRCEHCERRFYTRKDVRRHMVVHTGRKDFLCQYCAQRFGRKDHLTRHMKKSHAREMLRVKSEPVDMLEPSVYDLASSIKGEVPDTVRPQQLSTYPGQGLDSDPFPLTSQSFCLKYPLGFTSFSGSSQEHALKGDLETYLMPSSSSATEDPPLPTSKLQLEDPSQESKMSTPTAVAAGESLASTLMDFSQLFNFLPLNGPGYSGPTGGGGDMAVSYPSGEEPVPIEELSLQNPTSPEAADSSLQGLTPQFISSLSSTPTLPRFHQAFQ